MKSDPGTSRVTISGVRDDVLDELDALADAEGKTRSEKVVELIESEVADAVPDDDGAYLPQEDDLRTVYEAVLEVATMPDHTLRFDQWGGTVAQKAELSQDAVRSQLFRLQSRGYVRHQQGRDGVEHERECYRVKPRSANPKLWKYSKVRDLDAVRRLEATDVEDTSDQLDALAEAGGEVSESAD